MILVTGGAGFIGSNVVAALGRSDHRIAVCDVLGCGEKWRNLRKHPVHQFVDPPDYRAWLSNSGHELSAIVHMGAITSTTETNVDALIAANFRLSVDLWRYCSGAGIPLIYASSAATYGDGLEGFVDDDREDYLSRLRPLNPYGWSKHLFDRYVSRVVASGEPQPPLWAGLKFFNVYGPNEYHKGPMMSVVAKNFDLVSRGEVVRLFKSHRPGVADGDQRRDFVYVDDCVSVILWLLSGAGKSGIYNVGSGEARSFADLVAALGSACNRAPRIEFIDMPEEIRANYQYRTQADLGRLREAGYPNAMTTLERGVESYVSGYLATSDRYR